MIVIIFIGLVGLFGISDGFVQNGQCNQNIPLANNFDLDQFLGTWYEIGRAENSIQDYADCSHLVLERHTESDEAETLTYYNRAYNRNFLVERSGTVDTDEDATARLTLNLNEGSNVIPIDFWILLTDHVNFAVGYGCENVSPTQRNVNIWHLQRSTAPINELMLALINTTLINSVDVTVEDLNSLDHSDNACYELPLIEPGQPIVLPGECDPDITVVQDFDIEAFTGEWHELQRYFSENVQGTCPRAHYSFIGDTINVVNSHVIEEELRTISGTATIISTDGSGRLLIETEVEPGVIVQQELYIIATDYSNYAITYTCDNVDSNRRVFSWIFGRSRQLSDIAAAQVDEVVHSLIDLNYAYYEDTPRTDSDCFYFPEPVPSQPVVFRGQCDLINIPTMPGFNIEQYMGLWHDIESYPYSTEFQGGTCNNIHYTLNGDVVDIYHTQVIAQALDTINGNATLVSDDGSGKLVITLPISDELVEADYWVLTTDYISYALVYTCVNIDENNRLVWSWKLSRTKHLTETADTAINNFISTIPILDQRYYEYRDQTVDGCFYFPEPQEGVPVVFPGQCDDSIVVVNGFNLELFQGTWFEIETYPKDFHPGQCISHQYTSGAGNTLNLESNSVVDQLLQIYPSTLSFVSTDGSARLVMTLTDGVTVPFWVLSTDYTDFAFAYSCENINSDFRAIHSWKLSRNRASLSQAAHTAIDAIVDTIQVLDNVYFESIDQTDYACFFFPDLATGEPVILPGQCDPDTEVFLNFEAARYEGLWHVIESYPSDAQDGTCNDATYTIQEDGTILVYSTQVIDQTLDTITGSGTLLETEDDRAKLSVQFPGAPEPIEYWIIDTDYESYSVGYRCVNVNTDQRRVWSWKMSRTRSLTPEAIDVINDVVDRVLVLNNRYFEDIDNSDNACFYYPIPDGSPVIFRGQCDLSIAAVPNFNVANYMGLWHDIESYPSVFQGGTCNNAFYTLNGDVVNVFNTQVIDQSLDTISGEAVVVSDDGSARLVVTFPIAGTDFTVETNYWVLATDYVSYSLVYTCENIDEYYRRVWSWKLSRTKELTPNAETEINAIVNAIPVLDQRYYEPKDQTEEGCFYFPEPEEGVPVVFPGQCDESIAVVNDFNLELFLGTWHEIESYPRDFQSGHCINHQYVEEEDNTLILQTFAVDEETLQLSNNTLFFTSADNSARLVITLDDGTTIPFWILNTDYTDYALAYSCENLNSDFRAIYSWKLSRSRTLSSNADTTINSIISDIQVLDNVYYEAVDQSDAACFFLPDLAPGELVIFPGQCNLSIPVVQNFDAARYSGFWHVIESYAAEFQGGTCNDATYTVQEDGTILVYNTQVIDEALDTITGSATPLESDDLSAKFIVTFPEALGSIEYWILDTDYESYSLGYSCVNLNSDQRQVWSWKMSRTKSLSPEATDAINEVVNSIDVLNDLYYEDIDNSDDACFYYPIPDGNPVIFRGQCDMTIPAFPDFNVATYMDLWHDIEAYPSVFQGGTCNNAFYTLNGDVVDVFNTQVIDQSLDTISGEAVVVSDDGSARLVVTFPIAGTDSTVETDYWVLATDYSSYALVYTCDNIDDDHRQVWSWKLSRTKQLSANAETAINDAISAIPVLDQRYYELKDQTEEGCFYFPEPEEGVPVVFPGQCDESIAVMNNFNLEQFQGVWHEIETYPKDFQPGQCINHEYREADSTLELQISSVDREALLISNNTLSSIDNSARMVMTLDNGMTIPFWILNTDYTDYALVYSCENINTDFRAIFSWKLSRSKSLSVNANTAIDAAISDIQVLDNIYYEPVDQSDAACFYFPVLLPDDPVIFPGQCDPNIPVKDDFDPELFAGRWFDIESYYDDHEGTCIDSTFTQDESGYNIVATLVTDQTLETANTQATLAVDGSGRLTVNTPDGAVEYWILDTDYESYSLIYSCTNMGSERRRVRSWKLSRTRELTDASETAINAVIDDINVLDEQYFNVRDHSDEACFYYPEPVLGQPVRFRGQCDETIPAVPDFDLDRYMGDWFDIESYPQLFQDGTCATANYTAGDEVVYVHNTQVVNQLLDEIHGSAVLDSDDGSGKLLVSFPIDGTELITTSPYWVLATDYHSFSLVYSCRNIDDEYRSVSFWKLSREQMLSAEAQTAIDVVMETVPVLRQQYFEETGHTFDDCLYYPDNFGGPIIRNDGQCPDDSEVDVVTNFDAASFAGTWHEIARFPSELQNGACASSEFTTTGGNTFTMTQTIIYNERLNSVDGPAEVSSDGRGIITATLNGGEAIKLYILDVKYSDFALAYSCRDLDNDHRQIYSWKLSRSRAGLSQAANDRIDPIVFNKLELFEYYYDDTDQGNDGCFHYPVFDPLPDVITLPGPCDDSIQGKADFDSAAFMGRWFEISKYPQPAQVGTCSRLQYYPRAPSNDIAVVNSLVADSTLTYITGLSEISSNDGSGVFETIFFIEGETDPADYYVLETDYTSFSLIYTCRNLDDGNRQVSSWKLSRTSTLSEEANMIISDVIDSTQGLLEDYYTATSQSAEDCFYVPPLDESRAPEFRGACEDISGQENFNIQAYQGWWHEIERYPVNEAVGECISSQFEQTGGQLRVVDTNVVGDVGHVSASVVTVTTDGRLRRTFDDGTVVDSWVLATDYQTYSLLYSCETFLNEYGDENRRVWSAKHSKSRQLTAAAQDAINSAMENYELLYPQFYLPVDQSDSACFHYPEQAGETVILPGQCDASIPVVQNFDLGAYTGIWYQIERYPNPEISEDSTCIGVSYTLIGATQDLVVVSWEVVDGELVVRGGIATLAADGSGRLTVSMMSDEEDGPVTVSEVYVLSVDFAVHSLLYSCENVNQFQREITAYKLSRTRTMPGSGTAAINALIAQRQELHQPYFLHVDHDEECPEPDSGLLVKSSFIVILVCAILQLLL